jgi:hypothetical protein
MKKKTDETTVAPAAPAAAKLHQSTLDADEVALLNSLPTGAARAERAKLTQAETLMDEETLAGLERYRSFFESADVDVSDALAALPRALALRALKHRLDTALAIVQRNLADAVDPIATASSEVHRLVAAAPEHSKVRAAFAQMEKRWQETFKGGRPAKAADDATPAAPPTKPA